VAVLRSKRLPVTICAISDASEVYARLVGTEYFGVPSRASLQDWPKLSPALQLSVLGQGLNTASADIVLSSAGTISSNNMYLFFHFIGLWYNLWMIVMITKIKDSLG
jgi:hypothetical protein